MRYSQISKPFSKTPNRTICRGIMFVARDDM